MSDPHCHQYEAGYTRRDFLTRTSLGLGTAALASLLGPQAVLGQAPAMSPSDPTLGALRTLHHPPRVRRIIYLFQSGGPSQLDLFDHKPLLRQRNGEELPASVRGQQRLTGMTANQKSFPLAGSQFDFQRHGQSGQWMSTLLPHTAAIADELCVVRSMYTEAINHDPAVTFIQTGSQQAGRPALGSWLSYGLGSVNENLPAFCVLLSRSNNYDQPLYARLWGNGFLPSQHQGVQFRSSKDAVLYLGNPPGLSAQSRRRQLDQLEALHIQRGARDHDPDVAARIAQYEMAYRMQTSVPETMDLSDEPEATFEKYGPQSRIPGTFAANCLLARRLCERGVPFIQLYHQGWDQHGNLPNDIQKLALDTDQPSAALVTDLKQRGLLEDTLVLWGGEFGRTNYSQGKLTNTNYGRDHHPRSFTLWMAGAGVQAGYAHGETDPFGYNIIRDPVHVHDFQATLLHLLGIDHERFTYRYQGRRFRLTDVHGQVIRPLLA